MAKALVPVPELLSRVPGSALVDPILVYPSKAFAVAFIELRRRTHAAGLPRVEADMQTIYEQAKTEGRAEGKAETLLLLLHDRFGSIPAGVKARVLAAPSGQLDDWFRAALAADALDDIFGGPTVH